MTSNLKTLLRGLFLCAVFTSISHICISAQTVVGIYPDSTAERIAEYAESVRRQWKIPGMSLAVAHKGDIVLMEGFGVKETGKSTARHGADAAVTPQTVFHIGSMTKAFTATVIASMVDQGLLSWDDRVKDLMPDFDWWDDSVEEVLQVQDLLTHRTGLVAQVGTYIPNLGYNREDVYRMLPYIEPMYGLGEKFAYNNITFIVAARLVEHLTGQSWEDNVRLRIFEPLGMNSSTPGIQGYLDAGDQASVAHYFGHRKGKSRSDRGSIVISPLRGENRALHWVEQIGPAGSICSTAEDMIKWVEFHLRDNFLLSPYQMYHLHSPSIKVSRDTTDTRHYGLCWYIEEHDGCEVIYHTGTTWGFTGICGFVSSLDVSFALLCNSEVSEHARKAVMRRIIDLYNPQRTSYSEYAAEVSGRIAGNISDKASGNTSAGNIKNGHKDASGRIAENISGKASGNTSAGNIKNGHKDASGRIFQIEGADTLRDWSSEGLDAWFKYRNSSRRRAVPSTIERSSTVPDFSRLVGVYGKAPVTADGKPLDPDVFGDARIFMENGRLYMTIGRYGWTHRLEHSSGNMFLLTSDGHTFPIYFHGYTTGSKVPVSFEIDFNYNENFGPWTKK